MKYQITYILDEYTYEGDRRRLNLYYVGNLKGAKSYASQMMRNLKNPQNIYMLQIYAIDKNRKKIHKTYHAKIVEKYPIYSIWYEIDR